MKLLLDENLPNDLRHILTGHDARTVGYMGFKGLTNGELLAAAAGAGFDALLTMDTGLEFEQSALPLTVVLIRAMSNTLDDLRPLVPRLLQAVADAAPRTLLRVG